jgi:hypothetical protein
MYWGIEYIYKPDQNKKKSDVLGYKIYIYIYIESAIRINEISQIMSYLYDIVQCDDLHFVLCLMTLNNL